MLQASESHVTRVSEFMNFPKTGRQTHEYNLELHRCTTFFRGWPFFFLFMRFLFNPPGQSLSKFKVKAYASPRNDLYLHVSHKQDGEARYVTVLPPCCKKKTTEENTNGYMFKTKAIRPGLRELKVAS